MLRIHAFATHGNKKKVCYASEQTITATTPSVISTFTFLSEMIGLFFVWGLSGGVDAKSTAKLKE